MHKINIKCKMNKILSFVLLLCKNKHLYLKESLLLILKLTELWLQFKYFFGLN